MRFIAIVLATVTVAAIWSASASAAVYRGTTAQGEQVTIRTDGEGVPTRFWLKKYKAGCIGNTFFRDRGAGSVPPFDRATPRQLYDRGPAYEIRDGALRGGVLTRVRARLASPNRWTGTFSSRIRITKNGETVNRCRTSFGFSARLQGS